MVPATRLSVSAAFLVCLALVVILFGSAPVVGQPQQVTTDTPEYCLHLLDRVSELVRVSASPPPEEVATLSSEGQKMCDQGQTRGGILRLRRALILMKQQDERP